jgi:hypothetical protein
MCKLLDNFCTIVPIILQRDCQSAKCLLARYEDAKDES